MVFLKYQMNNSWMVPYMSSPAGQIPKNNPKCWYYCSNPVLKMRFYPA